MSETKKRNIHTPEFKAKVGLDALRGAKTINEIVKSTEFIPCRFTPHIYLCRGSLLKSERARAAICGTVSSCSVTF